MCRADGNRSYSWGLPKVCVTPGGISSGHTWRGAFSQYPERKGVLACLQEIAKVFPLRRLTHELQFVNLRVVPSDGGK